MSSSSKAFVTVNRPLALEIRRMEIVYSSIVTVKEGERRGFFSYFLTHLFKKGCQVY